MYSILGAFSRAEWEKYETTKYGKLLSIHTCGILEYCEDDLIERGSERFDYMLIYITKGRALVEIYGKRFTLTVGDVAIFPPRTFYKIYSDSYCQWYWVHFNTTLPFSDFGISDDDKISIGASLMLNNEFDHLIEECNNVDHNAKEICTCLFMGILFNIGRMYKRAEKDIRFSDKVDYAIKAMVVNEVARGNIKEYAAMAGCNEIKFREECKKRTGMTPKQYILHKRKLRIARELETLNYPLQKYADALGFRDYSYFCKFVKKQLGMSPENYIKAINKEKYKNNERKE